MGVNPGFGVGPVWAENTFLSAKARERSRRTPSLSAKARERSRRTPFYPRRHAKSQEKGHSAGHPQGHPQGAPLRWDGPVEGNVNVTSCHLARRRVGAKPGLTVASVSWGCEGRHRAGTGGDLLGLAGPGLAGHLRLGTCYEYRHEVGEGCCRRGGVAGAEPPHKGGPNRPDRPRLQELGDRDQGLGAAPRLTQD